MSLLRRHGDLAHLEDEPADAEGDGISREDLKTMQPDEISRLYRAGELAHLLKETKVAGEAAERQAEPTAPAGNADQGARTQHRPRTNRARLSTMTAAEIVTARRRGELDALMRGEVD